jgi:aspartate kinase
VRVVVQKYGGSSVADLERLRGVAARVARTRVEGAAVVVVVSAMGNTTNELIALAQKVSSNPDRRELDMLISVGERISVSLLAMALRDLGVPATSLTGSQSGIITDEAHADARVVAVRPDRIRQTLERGEVAIIAGFQGVSREREITTLGRGGSDTTAVVLAAALHAEYCEICSDVDGVWSADPRVVPDAARLDALSLQSALELARGGAKVLYEDAVRYARDRGLAIQASSTFGPGSGTRLEVDVGTPAAPVVTSDDQLLRVRSRAPLGAVAAWLRARGGRVRRRVGEHLFVDTRNMHGDISSDPLALIVEGPTSMVTAVASGLGEELAHLGAVESAWREAGVEPGLHGSLGDVAFWEIQPVHLAEATRIAHQVLRACYSTEKSSTQSS